MSAEKYQTIPDRLKDAALAALAGAGDEASFGLESKYLPAAKQVIQDNPRMAGVGRIGSYFLPVAGELGALREALRGGEALDAGAHALKAANAQGWLQHGAAALMDKIPGLAAKEGGSFLPETVKAATRGAGSAVAAGEGNAIARKGLGTDNGEPLPDATSLAETGAAGGMLGKVLNGLAPRIYNHAGLLDRYNPDKSTEQARELMNEGVWGDLDTFKAKAKELSDAIKPARQNILDPIANKRVGIQPLLDTINKKATSFASEDPEVSALNKSILDRIQKLGLDQNGEASMGSIDNALHDVNSEMSDLSNAQKGKIYAGGQGDVPGRTERLQSKKSALEDILHQGIDQNGSPGDLDAWKEATNTYRRGEDLSSNIRNYEGREMSSNPLIRGFHWVSNHSLGSPSIRTGAGVLANKANPSVTGAVAGELEGLKNRSSQSSPEQPPAPAATGNPYLDNLAAPAKAPAAQGKTGNPFLDSLPE